MGNCIAPSSSRALFYSGAYVIIKSCAALSKTSSGSKQFVLRYVRRELMLSEDLTASIIRACAMVLAWRECLCNEKSALNLPIELPQRHCPIESRDRFVNIEDFLLLLIWQSRAGAFFLF